MVDLFWDGETRSIFTGPRYPGDSAHGSGCTHSAALAAHLALGLEPLEAACGGQAGRLGGGSHALTDMGAGPGPVDALGIAAPAVTTVRLVRVPASGPAGRGPSGIIRPVKFLRLMPGER